MASASYSEDLTCPICLTIFTDPVTLLCGHSFCRGCITDALSSQELCPQCRTAVPTEVKSLPTSHILKRLAEKAKEAEEIKPEPAKEKAEVSELCPEHEEKLKLFCVTDQQLACIICRDGKRHEGHKFKPIKEAAASVRQELEKGMENLCGDILAIESLANTQREEIRKTKAKSEQLMTQILRQFEEMHQFLTKREDEIKNELKLKEQDDVEKMSKSLKVIETALSECREVEEKLTSVLKIEDSERLLKSWTEGNSRVTAEDLIKPKANDLQVVDSSLSLGPYESHLQFFMWKEMLQVIQPRAELLSLKSNNAHIAVSEDGRSLFSTPKSNQASLGSAPAFGSATGSGQTTGFGFGSSTKSSQTTGFGFGSTTGSGQTTGFGFGSSTGSGQTTGFGFGSTTGSGQTTGFGFGSSTGSGQTTGSTFGSSTGSGQTTGFGFGSTTGSGQKAGFGFGSSTGSGQTTGFGFGSSTGSGQKAGFGFGSSTGSGQTTGFGFGSSTGSGQTTGFGFGSTTGSGQKAGFGFGSSTGSGQTTGFGFGSSTGSGQTTGFGFGSTTGSGQKAGFGFGSSTGSGQTTGFGFGSSTGSGQTTGSTFVSTTGLGQTLN